MTMLIWNVRSMNNVGRRRDIKRHIHSLKPNVVGLLETKVKSAKAYRITKCIPSHWSYCNNYTASNKGRIWVAWDADVWNGTVISVTLQQITIKLQNIGGFSMMLGVIYGENSEQIRSSLWTDIRNISAQLNNLPWLLVGDFNVCRFTSEKIGGIKLNAKKLKEFNDCLQICGLSDIKSTGSSWTWHNNQEGIGRIYGKLDRALGNSKLFDKFPQAYIEYKCTSSSDHTPTVVQLVPLTHTGPKPFKFFNFWTQCKGYEEVVNKVWVNQIAGFPMFVLVSKLKFLKVALKQWNKQADSSPKANIIKLSNQLNIIQTMLNQDMDNVELQATESTLNFELNGWLDKEEMELRQKSRQLWLQQGDRNSVFFYNSIKHRISTNSIRYLIDQNGSPTSSVENMKLVAPKFYEELFNQSSYWNVFPKMTVKKILTDEAKQ
ncbi:uncharacterized protein LOC109835749 [Asparagus officinalis]|uniref:uncharacterized protein LOC109835749 n=1 Tax=Asparagus officinalis TaxID=4686 RepID=UPI00098E5BC0|nr:uncharacterized protein LOC109835749 [Asparagus officinalis]